MCLADYMPTGQSSLGKALSGPAVLSTHSSSRLLGCCAWYICAKVCLCLALPSTRNLDIDPQLACIASLLGLSI